jgi:hypothetical protein
MIARLLYKVKKELIYIFVIVICIVNQGCFMPIYTSFLPVKKGERSLYIASTLTANPYKSYESPVLTDSGSTTLAPEDIGASNTKVLSIGYRIGVLRNIEFGPNLMVLQFGREWNSQTIRPALGIELKGNFAEKISLFGELGCMYREQMGSSDDALEMMPFEFLWSYAFYGGIAVRFGKIFNNGDILSIGPRFSFLSTSISRPVHTKDALGILMLIGGYEKTIGKHAIILTTEIAPVTGTFALSLAGKIQLGKPKQEQKP